MGWVLVASASAALCAPAPAATAQVGPGLDFAQSGVVSVTWEAVEKGEAISLCNGADKEATEPKATLAGFRFKREKEDIAPTEAIEAQVPTKRIPAGDCGEVVLKPVSEGTVVDTGSYKGTVVAVSPGFGVASVEVEITKSAEVKPAVVSGATETLGLNAVNSFTEKSLEVKEGSVLLLKGAVGDQEKLSIGEDCEKPAEGESWDTTTCPFIGNLYKDSSIIQVYVAGRVRSEDEVQRLPVRLSSSGHAVGTYEGSLDPAGTGDKEEAVKVKLTVEDDWLWAVLALLLGTAIALGVQLWSGRYRPKLELQKRGKEIAGAYGSAIEKLTAPAGTVIKLDEAKVGQYATDVESAITNYGKSVLLFDKTSDAYKEIEGSIALAEADAKVLGDADGLGASLTALRTAVDEAKDLLKKRAVKDAFELLASAEAPLQSGELGVGDATERSKLAGTLTSTLGKWRKLAERVLDDEAWLFALAQRAEDSTPKPMSDADKATLNDAAMRLLGVHNELFQIAEDADLERLRTSNRIETSFGQLSYLGAKYRVDRPPKTAAVPTKDTMDDEVVRTFGGAVDLDNPTDAKGAEVVPRKLITREASAAQLPKKLLLFAGDSAMLLIGLAVAIVTGLSLFYFGKTFGTCEDYLTVIVVGTAAQTVAKAILDNLSAFAHDFGPTMPLKPPEAKVATA